MSTAAATQGTRFMVQWEEHPMHLATRLGYLLEHQSLVDVTLMCNTHTLKVHRSVLAACSPYFESVLQRQLGNHPLIVLKDMKFCVLKSLIEFMYCGETSVTEENLNPLMEAAKFFEVKGLCTMSKEVLGGERPSPNKAITAAPVNGTTSSLADIIPTTTYRGRGRRPGVGRGRRNLSSMLIPPAQGAPQAETAQIMLSLSGNTSGATLQTTSRNVRISPNSRMGRTLQTGSTILDSSKLIRNGALTTTDLKALREQLNLEPRKRGRRRQTFGVGRGRIRDLVDSKLGIQNIKKEIDDIQQKDGILFKPLESKINLFNNNGNTDAKSPLLASLLSKAEALAKAKVKTENDTEDGQTMEQETVLYQFDGESSGATKYLDALKEAGLPTDVPVLIDNGDGNYVTLTEDVLMNVLGNNEEFQFQVTEATLEQGDVSEGVVMQDGTIMMTGKNGNSDLSGPLLTVNKKPVTIKGMKEVKGKRGPKPKQFVVKDVQPAKLSDSESPQKSIKRESGDKKSFKELINEAVLESLKNGTANEAEADPDAVVLFEVTDTDKVIKYVVSSKEVSALKALNEQIEKQKKQNSPKDKKNVLPKLQKDGNTNIAEIKLTVPKNSRKSIVSEVLARAHSLESQVKNNILKEIPQNNDKIKHEMNSPQMIDINMATDVLNDSSQLMDINAARDNLVESSNMMDLSEESQMLDEDNSMVVLNDESQIMQIRDQHETINISGNANLIVVNNSEHILEQDRVDLTGEPNEDEHSQLMQIQEGSQDGEETEEASEDISAEEGSTALSQSGRDMPLLESESQLVELEFIDGDGEKIEGYRVEGTVLSQKEISELAGLSDQSKDSDVIGLLDMVCEEAAAQEEDLSNQVLNDVNTIKQNTVANDSIKVSETVENPISHSGYSVCETEKGFVSRTEHLVLEEVQNMDSRHLESEEISLDERECQELSVEQALQAMMGDENSAGAESQEFNQDEKSENLGHENSALHRLSHGAESANNLNPNHFEFVYESEESPHTEDDKRIKTTAETHILPHITHSETHLSESETHILTIPTESETHILPVVTESERHTICAIVPESDTHLLPVVTESETSLLPVITEPLSHTLPDESTNKTMTNLLEHLEKQENIAKEELVNTTIVSPTKDVPFAVGLLPLKDALVQIQSIHEHQPRKTRSGSTSKTECIGSKRRSSMENSIDCPPVRRRKSTDSEGTTPNQLINEGNVVTST